MGTETFQKALFDTYCKVVDVKLNNPLMGTETNHYLNSFQILDLNS